MEKTISEPLSLDPDAVLYLWTGDQLIPVPTPLDWFLYLHIALTLSF